MPFTQTVESHQQSVPAVPMPLQHGALEPSSSALNPTSSTVPAHVGRTESSYDAAQSPTTPSRVFRAIESVTTPPISPRRRFLIASLIIAANLVQFISNFVTISGGLSLSKSLGRSAGAGQANWMAASYSLTQGAFVLITGRLGAIYGHQRLALTGLFIFALFTLANGFCRSYDSFIAVRALSGVGGGVFMPNAVAVLTLMVPPGNARNVLLGLFAASPPIGGAIGALLAGVCAATEDLWSWTALFGSIAAGSALCMGLLWLSLPKEEPVDKGGKIDFVGAILGLSSLLLFSIAWNQAPSVGWSTPYEMAILILSVACFISFLLWERSVASEPIMPLTIFRAPAFLALVVVVLFSYMAFGIALWYSISWQQTLRNVSVLQVGVNFIPFGVGSTAAVALAAYMLPRVAAQWIMAVGVAVVLVASILLATMPVQQSYWVQIFPALLLCSFCPDFVYLAAQVIASNSVSRKHQGVASSLVGTLNLYGISLGLGFAGTIETHIIQTSLSGSSGSAAPADTVSGYRAALYFAAAIATVGLVLDFVFVRLPKNEREGWDNDLDGVDNLELQSGATTTAVERPSVA